MSTLPVEVVDAVKSGDVETVERYIDNGGDINLPYLYIYSDYDHGETEYYRPIFEEATSKNIITCLAQHKVKQIPNLMHRIYQQHGLNLVLFLLDCGYTIEFPGDSQSALCEACYKKDLNSVRELVARGANIKYSNPHNGHTVLHSCYNFVDSSNEEHLEILKMMIEHGADQKAIEAHYGGRLPQDFTSDAEYQAIKKKLHPLVL
jgi:hypothetical protein